MINFELWFLAILNRFSLNRRSVRNKRCMTKTKTIEDKVREVSHTSFTGPILVSLLQNGHTEARFVPPAGMVRAVNVLLYTPRWTVVYFAIRSREALSEVSWEHFEIQKIWNLNDIIKKRMQSISINTCQFYAYHEF